MLAPWKKSYDKSRQHIKKQRHHLADKGPCSQSYGFSSSHVRLWELDYKECWVPKNGCFLIVVIEKNFKNPLDSNEIQPVNPKGNQPWMFTGRTDTEAKAPILWPPDGRANLLEKTLILGKMRAGEVGTTEDEIVGQHHWLNGYEFGPAPGDSDGQGNVACCSPWSCRVRHDLAAEQQHGLQIIFEAMSFGLFCRYWNPHQVEKVNCMLPTGN